ncbi:bestrophin-4 isoform X4 [Eurytemora carolleeae]|nr:bestrophin-4 isoform X4 [Eurytemora carolleeae]|eukprot:XP_023326824.1 bestrophin-4-like isoform X4 [Eurytemora affinis]
MYRYVLVLDEKSKDNFEVFCVYCSKGIQRIPLSFILGFYVSQVVSRWWDQWNALAWPDRLAQQLTCYLNCRTTRRSCIRWACLSNVLTLRMISSKVALRFPTLEHLIEAGLLTSKELGKLDLMLEKTGGRHDLSWYPISWAQEAVRKSRKDALIPADLWMSKLQDSLMNIADQNWRMFCYGWVSIPLVYTQLVTIAVYTYFFAALFGSQYLTPTKYLIDGEMFYKVDEHDYRPGATGNLVGYDDSIFDMYIPTFTLLEFVFYFGWLKVAESLINPFGEDDDDFETNYIIDRNLQLGYLMVEREDVVQEDPFGEYEIPPNVLPHTMSSKEFIDSGPQMPTDNVYVEEDGMALVTEKDQDDQGLIVNLRPSIKSRLSRLGSSIRTGRRPSIASRRSCGSIISNRGRVESRKQYGKDGLISRNSTYTGLSFGVPQSSGEVSLSNGNGPVPVLTRGISRKSNDTNHRDNGIVLEEKAEGNTKSPNGLTSYTTEKEGTDFKKESVCDKYIVDLPVEEEKDTNNI